MPIAKNKKGLTAKQAKFVQEYLVDLNATQAAIRAGYSKKTAFTIGVENLRKPLIAKELQQRREKLQKKTEISQERVLVEEKRLAFADIREIISPEGTLIAPCDLPEDVARALAGVEVIEFYDKDGNKTVHYKYRFWDKGKSLERIGRHLGMFIDRRELSGPGGQPVQFVFVGDNNEEDV